MSNLCGSGSMVGNVGVEAVWETSDGLRNVSRSSEYLGLVHTIIITITLLSKRSCFMAPCKTQVGRFPSITRAPLEGLLGRPIKCGTFWPLDLPCVYFDMLYTSQIDPWTSPVGHFLQDVSNENALGRGTGSKLSGGGLGLPFLMSHGNDIVFLFRSFR